MINKPSVSSLVASQLPEFVREDYPTFVAFLQAYYAYLEQNNPDLKTVRDLDTTLDSFIKNFKNEFAVNMPQVFNNERFLLQHIKDQYLAKGSEPSFQLLFRLLFNKDVAIDYPGKQMLRASDGKWNQDVSVLAKVTAGHPDQIVGKMVDIVTPTKVIRVLIDRRQYIEIEVERVVQIADDIYEFYIDRRFFGNINIGDKMRYKNDAAGIYFTAEIQATTAKLEVQEPGTGFKVGQLYNIRNGKGTGSIMKVTRVNTTGGILAAEFIKFGVGYTTDFTSTIYADLGQDAAGTGGSSLSIIGTTVNITESTDGFQESGYINKSDYAVGTAIDGTYAGEVIREFGGDVAGFSSPYDPAVVKIALGPLGKYPGYYVNNDGFLNDAIFIQDSRYYQAYSYVIKIDERLDTYKSVVKSLVHPAGMAVFGEYDVRNEFDISIALESMIKIMALAAKDSVTIGHDIPYIFLTKGFDDIGYATEAISTLGFGKSLTDSISTPTESITDKTFSKVLSYNHTLYNGTTLDTESITPTDDISTKGFGKRLDDYPVPSDAISKFDITKGLQDTPVITDAPAYTLTKYMDSTVDFATMQDSGGFMNINPYAEAGWFGEQYVGTPINF